MYIKHYKIGPFTTSDIELRELFKAWIIIALVFTIIQTGISIKPEFFRILAISAVTVGLGFLLHELAHKLVAQHFGCLAEFRADNMMLILALLMSFAGFVFAAPGAVLISGPVGERRNGIISLAGPLTNYVLALLFVPFILLSNPLLHTIGTMGFWINAFLGVFNLIPFGFFDGKKILTWNKPVYFSMLITGIVLVSISLFYL